MTMSNISKACNKSLVSWIMTITIGTVIPGSIFVGQALLENVDAPTLREHEIGEAYRNKVRERMYLARDTTNSHS